MDGFERIELPGVAAFTARVEALPGGGYRVAAPDHFTLTMGQAIRVRDEALAIASIASDDGAQIITCQRPEE